MSIGAFLGLGGSPQYPDEQGWETFNNHSISGDWSIADWDEVIEEAHRLGITVFREDGWIMMPWRGEDNRFMTNNGGLKMAQQFLDGFH